MIDLEAHKKAEEEATPGPWSFAPGVRHQLTRTDLQLVTLMRNDHAEMIREIESLKARNELLRKELERRDREALEMSNAYSEILTESATRGRELEGYRIVERNGLSSFVNGFSCSFCGARDVTLTVGPEVAICEACADVAARSKIRELRAKLFEERARHYEETSLTHASYGATLSDDEEFSDKSYAQYLTSAAETKASRFRAIAAKIRKGEM